MQRHRWIQSHKNYKTIPINSCLITILKLWTLSRWKKKLEISVVRLGSRHYLPLSFVSISSRFWSHKTQGPRSGNGFETRHVTELGSMFQITEPTGRPALAQICGLGTIAYISPAIYNNPTRSSVQTSFFESTKWSL